jgi:hypothetical protein
MDQSLTSFDSVKHFYSARHQAQHNVDDPLHNRRNRFCINPAKVSQVHKKIERKVANRDDLLFSLVSLYKKEGDKKDGLGREERMRRTTTPLEERTNLNVYYWYYQDSNENERANEERMRMAKHKHSVPNLSLFTDSSIQSFSDLTQSLSSQFKEVSQIMSPATAKQAPKIRKYPATAKHAKFQVDDKPPTPVDQQTTDILDILNDRDCQLIDDENTQRFLLNSAAIKHMPLDKRFHTDAKSMIFVPKSKSFYPKSVDHVLKNHI